MVAKNDNERKSSKNDNKGNPYNSVPQEGPTTKSRGQGKPLKDIAPKYR